MTDKVGKKSCFVIAPIGEENSETRKRSDQVLKYVIKPAVEHCGYEAQRADEIDQPGIIASQVIQRIVSDQLVVADLTERNPNVFYELAIRHMLRLPLVQIIRKGEIIPFDVYGTRTISFDHQDLDSVESAKEDIISQIKNLEKNPQSLETPISVSVDIQSLRESENAEDRRTGDLLSGISDITTSIKNLDARLFVKEKPFDEVNMHLRVITRLLDEIGGTAFVKLHPTVIRDISINSTKSPEVTLLMVASMFRDYIPWIYELGIEAYRSTRNGSDRAMRNNLLIEFEGVLHYTLENPFISEISNVNPIIFSFLYSDSRQLLRHAYQRLGVYD